MRVSLKQRRKDEVHETARLRENELDREENKMIKEAIVKIVNKEDLTYSEAYEVMKEQKRRKVRATYQ